MSNFNRDLFTQSLQSFLQKESFPISLHEPFFQGHEWDYVKQCLDTRMVSSVGQFVNQFEKQLAEVTGAKYAVVTVNGTAALHIAFLLAGVVRDDEVLVPTLTFVATCNAIAYCGAKPHFVDVSRDSLGVDPIKLEAYLKEITELRKGVCVNRLTGRPIRVLCVMHTFGHPVDLDPLIQICDRYHLKLIEDAAEALGSYYKGKHVGHHGFCGALSFNGNKIITTGGGGAIITDDEQIAKHAKYMTTTAKQPHTFLYYHDEVGYNYRLPNINSALGCAQLEQLPDFLKKKRVLAGKYQALFKSVQGISFVKEPNYATSNYWLNAILLEPAYSKEMPAILTQLNELGIHARPVWSLMHTLPMYQECPRMDLSVSEDIATRLINLPSSVFLKGSV